MSYRKSIFSFPLHTLFPSTHYLSLRILSFPLQSHHQINPFTNTATMFPTIHSLICAVLLLSEGIVAPGPGEILVGPPTMRRSSQFIHLPYVAILLLASLTTQLLRFGEQDCKHSTDTWNYSGHIRPFRRRLPIPQGNHGRLPGRHYARR